MEWDSQDDVIREFKLSSTASDMEGINRELVSIQSNLHPDRHGGVFPSPEDKEKYHRVSDAIRFISDLSSASKALIPISQLPAIIKAINEAQMVPKETQIYQFRKDIRQENHEVQHSSYRLPRVGSGMFGTICLGLFTFSNVFEQHAILGPLLENSLSQYLLLVFSGYAGVFFTYTWFRERRQEARVEFLLTEDGLRESFSGLLEKGKRFSLRDVLRNMYQGRARYRISALSPLSILLGGSGIRSSILEKIANAHLLELENRGAIHRLDIPSIEPTYEVDANLDVSSTPSDSQEG